MVAQSVIALAWTPIHAQTGQGVTQDSTAALTRPEVIQDAVLRYPPQAWDNDVQGDVVLLLWVSEEGLVETGEVVSTPGYGMELAAMAAAKKMRFSPALMAGEPVKVKIRYTFRFRKPEKAAQALPPLAVGPQDSRPKARLFGRVLQKGTGNPLVGAEVYLLDLDEAVLTDAEGRFGRELSPGGYAVTVNVPQHHAFETLERLEPGSSVEVKYYVEPNRRERYRTIVWGDEGRAMVGRTSLAAAEISEVAGTVGDPIRVIMLMPGVTTSMSGLGYPVVRGALPGDARYEMDGVQVPMLYHLGFGTAVVNPRFTSGIVFQPGGYSVQHGQFPGALVMGQAARPPEHPTTASDLSIVQLSLFHARPLTGNLQTLGAVRMGTLGLIIEGVASDAIFKYWDYQNKTFWQVGEDDHVEFLAFGAGNKVGEKLEGGGEDVVVIDFHRMLLRERHTLDSGWLQVEAEYGQEGFAAPEDEEDGDEAVDAGYAYGALRAKASVSPRTDLEVHWGAQAYLQDFDFVPDTDSLSIPTDGITVGGYAEVEWTPGDWTVIPGVRVDHYRYGLGSGPRQTGVDPRLALGYQLTRWLAAKASAGVYHGPPRVTIAEGPIVIGPVPGMVGIGLERGLTRSMQVAAGLEADLPWSLQAIVQGYDSTLRSGLDFSLTETNLGIESSPDEEDEPLASKGRSYGLEFVLRRRLGGAVFGWVTYSLSHSERKAEGYGTMILS
jgi:TonB family protein